MNRQLEKTLDAGADKLHEIRDFDYLGAVGLQKKPHISHTVRVATAVGIGALAIAGILTAWHYNVKSVTVSLTNRNG